MPNGGGPHPEVRARTPCLVLDECGRASLEGRNNVAPHTLRSTIIFLISAIALAGFRPFGQVWAQFMMVWQR
jgi:hypothetical protein